MSARRPPSRNAFNDAQIRYLYHLLKEAGIRDPTSLAARMGLNHSAVSTWFAGRGGVSEPNRKKLAKKLGVSFPEFQEKLAKLADVSIDAEGIYTLDTAPPRARITEVARASSSIAVLAWHWYPVVLNGMPRVSNGPAEGAITVLHRPVPDKVASALGPNGKGVLLEDDELDRWRLYGYRLRAGCALFTNPDMGGDPAAWEGKIVLAEDTTGVDRAGVLHRAERGEGWVLTTDSSWRRPQLTYPCKHIYGLVIWTQLMGGVALDRIEDAEEVEAG